jgi:OmpA-OmpF porin, OOP family
LTKKEEKVLLWDPAIQLSYWHAFTKKWDMKLALHASNVQYPTSDNDSVLIKAKQGNKYLRAQLPYFVIDAKAHYSLWPKESHILSPYLLAGLSASFREKTSGFDIPIGLGLNIKLAPGFYINLEPNYRMAVTSKNQDHLSYALGIVYWWKGTKEPKPVPVPVVTPKPVPVPVVIKDEDNDGVEDAVDKCPHHAGPKDKAGCPDKDNDGIYDFEDRCPNEKGLAKFAGCPDSDGDGIIDSEDRCPNEAGVKENQGCPEIKKEVIEKVNIAAKGVNFETAKAILTEASYKQLDVIVDALLTDPLLNVDIEGHTDNKGKPEKNLVLSQQRADVCKDYLMKKGIAENRISSVGYGDMHPIADNNTEEGRAQNRRTEFLLKR